MSFRAGRLADISVSGNLIGQFCDTITFPMKVDSSSIEVFKSTFKSAISGQKSWSINLSGSWDPTVTTGPAAVLVGIVQNDSVACIYYPGGNTAGQRSATFNALLTDYQEESKTSSQVLFTATLLVVSDVTYASL